MTTNTQNKSANTWKPTTAGILSIVAGVIAILLSLRMFRRHEVIGYFIRSGRWRVAGIFALIFGVMSIIGGIFALIRKAWGAALAGAITALYPFGIFGILAIIFVALSKGEFNRPAAKATIIPESTAETKSLSDKSPKP
jgi:hypothetical protein